MRSSTKSDTVSILFLENGFGSLFTTIDFGKSGVVKGFIMFAHETRNPFGDTLKYRRFYLNKTTFPKN